MSISATARVTRHSRNTIAHWLERASKAAERFNRQMLRDFEILELQADELCTFIGNKSRTMWLFAIIEVSSRLWTGSRLGRRSYRNTTAVLNDVLVRGRIVGFPLIATDGFEYYFGVIVRLMGPACVYGQVIKTRRNNRVVRVDRRVKVGTATRLRDALLESEDSETLNKSFVERLNLTIRQGSAYLRRRSTCHARCEDQLRGHVELLRCHYNFIRRHRGLKFGSVCRTPAMQAGLVTSPLSFRDIFTAHGLSTCLFEVLRVTGNVHLTQSDGAELLTLFWPHKQRTAGLSTENGASTNFFVKGGTIGCMRMAADYAPEAFSEIDTALSGKHNEAPCHPASCAAMLAKKMGASDRHAVMAAGFAGGIGLSGGACGALGTAIWIIGMNGRKEGLANKAINSRISDTMDSFLKSAGYEFECSEIVGRRFENIGDHAGFLRQGGCSDIVEALAAAAGVVRDHRPTPANKEAVYHDSNVHDRQISAAPR